MSSFKSLFAGKRRDLPARYLRRGMRSQDYRLGIRFAPGILLTERLEYVGLCRSHHRVSRIHWASLMNYVACARKKHI